MIRGVHCMFYSSDVEGARAFLRDKLGFAFTDVGQGWLIFEMPEADMGCHPEDMEHGAQSGLAHISFYCDDVNKTVEELKAKGVEFTKGVEDHGYGLVTMFRMPGGFDVQLYQPRYVKNFPPKAAPAAAAANGAPARKKPSAKKKPAPKPAKAMAKKKGKPAKARRR